MFDCGTGTLAQMTASSSLLRLINLRHLLRRKLRTSLTVAGVAAGVALVFSISVINTTLLSSVRASVEELAGTAELEVASAGDTGLAAVVETTVEAVPGVEAGVPVARVMTTLGERRIFVLGVTPEFTSLFPPDAAQQQGVTLEGDFGPLGGGVVLAERVAGEAGVTVGSKVEVGTPGGRKEVEVTGLLRGASVESLNGGNVGVMFLPTAQAIFERGPRIDSVYVILEPGATVAEVEPALEAELGGAGIVGPPGERGRGFEQTFAALSTLTSLAGLVALFVAMFVVYNTMSMALVERRREISMAQTLGATRKQLLAAFMGEALLLGLLSSAAGIAAGLALARVLVGRAVSQYSILPITGSGPIVVRPAHLLIAASGGLFVCLAGAYIPARRVLGVLPIEALRPEASYEWSGGSGRMLRVRSRLLSGVVAVALSLGLLLVFATMPERKWLAASGLLAGLTGITFLLPVIVPVAVRLVAPAVQRLFGPLGRLAADALKKNPGRTTFTVAALVLTLAMVVSVGAALGSYEAEIEKQARFWFGSPLFVSSDSFNGLGSDQPLPAAFESDIEGVEGVGLAYAQRYGSVDIRGQQALLYALPVDEAMEAGATDRLSGFEGDETEIVEGLKSGGVVVSQFTADHYGLETGGEIELPTPSGPRSFPVAGVFPDLASFDSMYIDLDVYRRLWQDDKVDRFALQLEPGADEAVITARLEDMIAATGAPAEVLTKGALIESILEAIRGLFSIARAIQLAALVIAALTIANTMFTAVIERRWESGLTRALGMKPSEVRRTVMIEAAVMGAVGSAGAALLGSILGLLMTRIMEVQFSWSVTFREPWALVGLACLGGVVISVLAGALPSRLAARTSIVDSLRYE